ncbi:hypothetical protein TSAR_006986 [Trichomalopsis sarcophagae]|uniref:Uncharacterized protein n=1 Tax=Trichomalopsis sarcophagae TaxID=543379 RepID=A0A232EYH6_9HYME|nr:hypothetical protein TSAR_006986 [Trichomalopsis sarcophagae]
MVGMSELKKPRRVTVRVPGNRLEPGVVLNRLSHRHPDLLISRWRVLSTESREGLDCGTFLVLSIPETSVRLLQQRNSTTPASRTEQHYPVLITMTGDEIVFTQINLHHSKGASAALVRRMAKMHTDTSSSNGREDARKQGPLGIPGTDWAFFRENLRNELQSFKLSFGTTDELDDLAFELGEIVNISFQRSYPWTVPKGTWGTPWWNRELEDLRRGEDL